MTIPNFIPEGVLPVGIHDCNLSDIKDTFVYNNKRKTIWKRFSSYITQVIAIKEVDTIYVDGSFVTDKELPSDVDVVLEIVNYGSLLALASQNIDLFDQDNVKNKYNTDLWFYTLDNKIQNDLRLFFQYLKQDDATKRSLPIGSKKGILRISLNNERKHGTI